MRNAFRAAIVLLAPILAPASVARAAPPAGKPSSATTTVEAWTATCDNLRACVVIGSSEDGDGLFYVRVGRAGGVGAAPEIKIVLAANDPIPVLPGAFMLDVRKGGADDRFTAAAAKDDAEGAAIAAAVPDPAFLASIANADMLDYAAGTLKGHLALKGLPEALRFIDERQGRTGTPTALVARGMTPIGQVPAPPAAPQVQAASGTATAVSSPTLGAALLDMAKPACDPEVVAAHSDAAAWTLGPDRQLVAIPCTEGATNVSSALFITDAKGENPRPAMLEQPPRDGDAAADNVVANYDFDTRTLSLTSLDKGRGLGDCGAMRSWVWTGEIFALLRAAELEACPGALPEDWPAVYVAVRK